MHFGHQTVSDQASTFVKMNLKYEYVFGMSRGCDRCNRMLSAYRISRGVRHKYVSTCEGENGSRDCDVVTSLESPYLRRLICLSVVVMSLTSPSLNRARAV